MAEQPPAPNHGAQTWKVGFIGLGQMGTPMAGHIAAAGHAVAVLDVSPEVTARFAAEHQAMVARNAAELAAHSDVVITMLPDGATVKRVFTESADGNEPAIEALRTGSIVIDMSSSAPHQTVELAGLLRERGVDLIDAPVSGGVARAVTGTLAIMAGGDTEVIKRHRPLLLTMGSTVTHAGSVGSGHAAKALNNAVSAAGLIAACEALIIGQRFGLEPEVLLEILNSSTGRNNGTENKVAQFILSRTYASGFSLQLLAKDLGIADELAHQVDVPDTFAKASLETVTEALRWLDRPADHTEVASFLEHAAGSSLTE